jgi:hypothetical protein
MDREQIYQEIIKSYGDTIDPQEDHRWGSMLAQCRPEEIFWGCMFVFQRGNINYQWFAGYLLDKMKPKVRPYYLLDLGEVLRSMIDDWNVSVPQLPSFSQGVWQRGVSTRTVNNDKGISSRRIITLSQD